MRAWRCSLCGISYPADGCCPICEGPLDAIQAEPTADWEEEVQRRLNSTDRDEFSRVFCWRRKVLLRAGYALHDANLIAERFTGDDTIDLHQAVGLLERGCAERTAVEILL